MAVDPLDYVFSLETLGIKFGLHNIGALCAALDHPERAFRSVIVAGTNGKGSVSAMLERGLRAAGLRTARYTSPHLSRLEERFAIDGQTISTDRLREVAAVMPAVAARLREQGEFHADPTFFEVTTAIAFDLFRRANVQIAVLEVGMGGRLDATSIAPAEAAAITTIDFDHERYLGNTLAEIAFEKAGVIRHGMPVVVGESKPEPLQVIEQACRDRGARLVRAHDGVQVDVRVTGGQTTIDLRTPKRTYPPIRLALRGRHQVDNAIVAVRLLEEMPEVGPDAIVAGLTDVVWPGRLDLIQTATGPVLFDGAHNPAGARMLKEYLEETYADPVPLVFGAMADKDAASMLAGLRPRVAHLVVTRPRTPRAATVEALTAQARAAGYASVEAIEPAAAALARAQQFGAPTVVAGSLFLVGDLLADLAPPTVRL